MTYSAQELSADDGLPVRLYEFRRGQIVYRYTSADRDIVWNSATWESKSGGVLDDGIKASGPTEQDEMSVGCCWDLEVVSWFRGTPPSDWVTLTVRRVHYTDDDLEAAVVWVGRVTALRQPEPGKAVLFCQSVMQTFQQQGLRLTYGKTCPHFLYDDNCRVNKASFDTAVTVDAVAGLTVTADGLDAHADGWFDGGFIEWDLDLLGTVERRPVESHVGNVLTLLTLTDGLTVGTDIRAYPGCARNTQTCSGKFSNLVNYGGFPHMPGVNPFEIGVLNGVTQSDNKTDKSTGVSRRSKRAAIPTDGGLDGSGVEQTPAETGFYQGGGEGDGGGV